ncbi:cytosolic beta-glucosidase-like [Cydia pomonella]|uniref:cytosolic beta-glucosidase-like n=1 Tax=Cydia pomonella TaxID=82600 RepID=UPI002ADE6AB4|nr:cytosolic beta-glucosidase-like [Cydia pomonella]
MWLWTVLPFFTLFPVDGVVVVTPELEKRFPDNFLFGVSSSAYQIEGSWNVDGKGQSIWDYYPHKQPEIVQDCTNADVTADSYRLFKQDIQILKHLGVKSYRFSISWTRILPDGTTNYINPRGIAHYRKFIDLLLENDILPFVTLFHWDLPIAFGKNGSWLNENTVDRFGDYVRVAFLAFGDKVKHWITINEPYILCLYSYELGMLPPLIKSPGKGFYECGRNMLLGHAKAYRIYDEEFRFQGGEVGLTLDAQWPIAASGSEEDAEAVKDYLALYVGQYLDPVIKGDYPQRLTARVAAASARQGTESRLRPLTEEEKKFIHGTYDFIGINHYTSVMVYRNESVNGMYEKPSFYDDVGIGIYVNDSWPASSLDFMKEYAPGFYSLLLYLKDTYNNPLVYITENGFPLSSAEGLDDRKKVNYIRNYLDALMDARADGSNCQGYFVWSLMDSFEWAAGYQYKFGLYQVDFDDPDKKRTARKSALVYKEIIRTGTIDVSYDPDPYQHNGSLY